MKILITGAGGFLGRRLAKALLDDDGLRATLERIVLLDREPPSGWVDERVTVLGGDIADPEVLADAVGSDIDIVYHLAAVVSGEAEADFDLGMRVNVDGSRRLLDACRVPGHQPRVIFTSSVAVFGPRRDDTLIDDHTAVDPQSSYGMEKAVAELLLKDYTRRGFVDGIVLRLPTVSVRPGKPNRAASSFASSIIREPLAGQEAICPVAAETPLWLVSPRAAITNLIHAADIRFEDQNCNRIINLPGLTVNVSEMVAALERFKGANTTRHIRWKRDRDIEAIVASWPSSWDDSSARHLGFAGDQDFEAIIRAYVADELGQ